MVLLSHTGDSPDSRQKADSTSAPEITVDPGNMVHLASPGHHQRCRQSRQWQRILIEDPRPKSPLHLVENSDSYTTSVYGSRFAGENLPKVEMPETEMPKEVAYRLIKDDLSLDGRRGREAHGRVLFKNFIDYEEYPQSADIQNRCVSMIGRLFHAPVASDGSGAVGTSCVGSSEAIMLAVLAMKKRWKNRRTAAGLSIDKPNIIMSSAVQVCWEKAARYFELEEKLVYCAPDRFIIDPEQAADLVDENTIGICVILGTTYTGEYEDVRAVSDILVERKLDVPIHVDAASGGFVAPFISPELEWDFRCEKVVSINVSGHKYGLVYPGVGWVLWRSPEFLPQELVFNINYLGADQASFTLNFSKGASQVIGQYYQLIRLGKREPPPGQQLHHHVQTRRRGLPLVAFRFKDDPEREYDEFTLAHQLRVRGWVVPAYTMAPHTNKMKMLRVVVREDFSKSRCDNLIADIKLSINFLDNLDRESIKKHEAYVLRHNTASGRATHNPLPTLQVLG
ncbi:unnamed protein product [Parascedosporium putredinis]|uniref:Glutamate decarboxylase n=1 Tax=Parascedosporium putredinis TaxID=1442378 RepID=A0A9P1H711_9PEZI|nr:unnamed protein product [Parascedosporium putredinis]CAI7999392.1 unnamed protein product [Parascedosporium putredinis]